MTNQTAETICAALADRIAIEDVICAVTLHSDLNEPEGSLRQYTHDAIIDYSNLSGPESRDVPVSEHRRRLMTILPGFDTRHHQTTNFEIKVEGDEARARSQVRATHMLGSEAWIVGGTYHHRLVRTSDGWKICYQRADIAFQEGQHLVEQAMEIVAEKANTSV